VGADHPSGHHIVLCDEAEIVNELLHLDMAISADQWPIDVLPIGASIEHILCDCSLQASGVFVERLNRANVQEGRIRERSVLDTA
jgi:hypothetical protein